MKTSEIVWILNSLKQVSFSQHNKLFPYFCNKNVFIKDLSHLYFAIELFFSWDKNAFYSVSECSLSSMYYKMLFKVNKVVFFFSA